MKNLSITEICGLINSVPRTQAGRYNSVSWQFDVKLTAKIVNGLLGQKVNDFKKSLDEVSYKTGVSKLVLTRLCKGRYSTGTI